MRASVK
jgi:hypothetical protein